MAASGAGPLEFQRLEFLAQIDGAILADVEGIVVEENFLHLREIFESLLDFPHDVVDRTRAPGMAGNGLRPHTEGAHRRAAARGVEGNERVQQKRHVVVFDLQVALVDVGGEGQRVELCGVKLRTRRVVNDLAVFAKADAEDFARTACRGRIRPRNDRTHRG